MLDRQDLADGAPYRLPNHGRVTVTFVDGKDALVYFERADGRMCKLSTTTFRQQADPLPVTVALPTADVTVDTNLS